MSDELRDRIADVIHGVGADHWNDMAQAVIDDLGLVVTSKHQEHKAGSAVEFGETEEQYRERTRLKTYYRISGGWSE